jgi:uncharacterized protein YceK
MTVMAKRLIAFVSICLVAILVGCSSLNYHSDVQGGMEAPRVYPGIREDYRLMVNPASKTDMWLPIFWPFTFSYGVLDLPFSFAVDTLYLPFDIYEVARTSRPPDSYSTETNSVSHGH